MGPTCCLVILSPQSHMLPKVRSNYNVFQFSTRPRSPLAQAAWDYKEELKRREDDDGNITTESAFEILANHRIREAMDNGDFTCRGTESAKIAGGDCPYHWEKRMREWSLILKRRGKKTAAKLSADAKNEMMLKQGPKWSGGQENLSRDQRGLPAQYTDGPNQRVITKMPCTSGGSMIL